MSVDQTFHTPSFGDEEFDIPPLSYAPTAAATRCSGQGVYANQVPVEYLKRKLTSDPFCVYLPRQENFNDCRLYNQQPLTHFRPSESLLQTNYQHSSSMNNGTDQSFHHQQQPNRQNCYQNDMLHSMAMQMQYDDHAPFAENSMQPPQMTVMQQTNQMMGPPQQTPIFSTINQSQLGLQMGHPQNSQAGSPPGSNHNSPGLETSEDSDDSTPLAQLMSTMKRPSPEPADVSVRVPKKPKAPKKKKKRDPNEPQKPVSAYALFFRDTQAAIKGQNPNASFGEVSKIVASMWDSLDADAKQSYKAKTENAKKEYLKQLAAYRATLVSKAAVDQSDSVYGSSTSNTSPPSTHSPNSSPQGHMMQKQSPILTSVVDSMQPVTNSMNMHTNNQQGWHMQSPHHMNSNNSPPHVMQVGNNNNVVMGMHQSPHLSSPQQQMGALNNNMSSMHGNSPQMCNSASNSPTYNQNISAVSSGNGGNHTNLGNSGEILQTCLRNGCLNPAIDSADWDREYCSSECVVSHCKDVFANWVAQRQVSANPYSTVK